MLAIHVLLALLFLRANYGAKARRPQVEVRADILNLVRLPQLVPRARGPIQETETSRLLPKHLRSLSASGIRSIRLPDVPEVPLPQHSKSDWYHAAADVTRSLTSLRPPTGPSRLRRVPQVTVPGLRAAPAIRLGSSADSSGT